MEAQGKRFARLLVPGAVVLGGLVFAAATTATPVTFNEIVNQTDWTQAGVSGVGDSASVNIALSDVSGTVEKAYLYYHGIGNPAYAPTGVTFAGAPVTPVPLGNATTNCWGAGSSTAYRADVTAQVTGNGTYAVANLANGVDMNANGASLIVFFDDGNAANNRDVALFEGNDSDHAEGFPGETDGWHSTLSNITYTTGTANAYLHAADGQQAADGNVVFTATPNNGGTNPLTIVDTATLWEGVSLPDAGRSRLGAGQGLYDTHGFDITGLFNSVPASYTVNLDQNPGNDCLGLILAALDFEAGALPQEICGNGIDDDGDGQIDEDCPAAADLAVAKSDSPDPVEVGQELTYTITVGNDGPDSAADVTVTDTLPGTVTLVSATSSQGTPCTGTSTVTCNLGTINSGNQATVTIKVVPNTDDDLSNTASASSTTADPNTANNSDTELTVVDPAPTGPMCNGLPATFVGDDGDDYFQGTPGVDVIVDSGGDNYIQTGGGDDHICVGDGDDEIDSGDGNDFVDAGEGNNKIKTGNGSDTVRSGNGNDDIDTGDGNDNVVDTGGRNKIFTGNGADNVTSGPGNDEIETGNGNDVVVDSGGNNSVNTGDGNDTITTGAGNDRIDGGNGFDTCNAGGGTNRVRKCEA